MTVIPRFLVVLALLAAVLPAVSAHGKKPHCKPNEYYYERKGYCVAKNHHKNHAVDPPRGKGCPSHWYWSDAKHCCLPYSPPHHKWDNYVPTCPKGQKWDNKESYCHGPPSRGSNYPHHGNDNPHHGNNNPHHGYNNPHHGNDNPHYGNGIPNYQPRPSPTDQPPTGFECPKGWFWDTDFAYCVSLTETPPPTTCPDGDAWIWVDVLQRCQLKSDVPPTGFACPQGWIWNKSFADCVPLSENPAPKICDDGWMWITAYQRCQLQPTPLGPYIPDPTHRWI